MNLLKITLALKSIDTPLNILVSYAYLGEDRPLLNRIKNWSEDNRANFMLDSGAFTLFNSKQKSKHINLYDYINFCGQYGDYFEKWFRDFVDHH